MTFLLFLRGMIGVLIVFAVTTYFTTHSLWATFVQTLVCAVLLQVGYFAAVLFLVWRASGQESRGIGASQSEAAQTQSNDDQPGKAGQLPGVPRSPHS